MSDTRGAAMIAMSLTDKARSFLLLVKEPDWWRPDEGERVPSSLLTLHLIRAESPRGFGQRLYCLTPLGLAVRDHLESDLP